MPPRESQATHCFQFRISRFAELRAFSFACFLYEETVCSDGNEPHTWANVNFCLILWHEKYRQGTCSVFKQAANWRAAQFHLESAAFTFHMIVKTLTHVRSSRAACSLAPANGLLACP